MEHSEKRLIKSFKSVKNIGKTTLIGDIIEIRKHQSQVPLTLDELYFETVGKGHTFTFGWLFNNVGDSVEIHESFPTLKEKFEHIK